ncbi:hypothetical protein KZZ08_00630 [Roseovarius mucosus]|uniref:hypothetical protein n=1 Tax=Roseovarius mucosus TaxID=215743 RepID=UPI001C5DDBF7|nr:hypothetical protein [Roseovarius mucosus]MBW4972101.1 hypothetical protein [Roseovarius mucosus]
MVYDQQIALRMAAFAAAMRAKVGNLDAETVADLVAQAEGHLTPEDALAQAIARFAQGYREHRRQADRLAELGRDLSAFIETLNMPVPPDLGRKDIHG